MNEDAITPLEYCIARRTPQVKRHGRKEWPICTDYDLAAALAEFASPAAFAATRPTELRDALAQALFSRDLALAELRWCDAERRLALRALAEYAPACDDCVREVMARIRLDRDMHLATNELRGLVYCDEHLHADRPLVYAAQIAAADEEMRK